ncbi:MAG: efflux RND transporter periplasmic adaptor subunit, partial [Alphaproteobacteria bacterium]
AEIIIELPGQTGHLLPTSALTLDDDGRLGVRIIRDGRARFVPVRVIRDTADGLWIAGLDETADVIIVGQEFVGDGKPVTATFVREREPR